MKRLALILLFVLLGTAAPLPADDAAAPATGEAAKVDAEAARLLKEARYAWRSPRPEHSPEQGESLPWEVLRSLGDALKPAWDWFEGHVRSVMDWLGRLLDHLLRGMPWDKLGRARQGVKAPELGDAPLWVAWFLLGGAAVAVALILLRRARAPKPRAAQVGVLPPPVDLARASLSGAELPEDGWLKLARELEAKGEHRLALRAYFLAGLNALGKAGLLSLAPSRSVGDYRRQLARRAARVSGSVEDLDEDAAADTRTAKHDADGDSGNAKEKEPGQSGGAKDDVPGDSRNAHEDASAGSADARAARRLPEAWGQVSRDSWLFETWLPGVALMPQDQEGGWAQAAEGSPGPARLPMNGFMALKLDDGWKVWHRRGGEPVAAERPYGQGALVVLSDAFAFSNEGLRTQLPGALAAACLKGRTQVTFDERQVGVWESPDIAELAWRAGLGPLAVVLALLGALWLWRSLAPLLPARASAEGPPPAAAGQLPSLLRGQAGQGELLERLIAEWEAGPGRHAPAHKARAARERMAQWRAHKGRDPKAAYNDIHSILKGRTTHGPRP